MRLVSRPVSLFTEYPYWNCYSSLSFLMANSYSDRRDKSRSPAYEGLEVANPNDGRPFNFATDDGLQVLPHEFVVDKKQGLLHATSNEGKEVVPLDSSNSAPEFLENRSTADSSKPYRKRRRPLSLLIILSTIGITILVAAIVPAVVVTQKHKSETSRWAFYNL